MILCSPVAWPVGKLLDWLLGPEHHVLFRCARVPGACTVEFRARVWIRPSGLAPCVQPACARLGWLRMYHLLPAPAGWQQGLLFCYACVLLSCRRQLPAVLLVLCAPQLQQGVPQPPVHVYYLLPAPAAAACVHVHPQCAPGARSLPLLQACAACAFARASLCASTCVRPSMCARPCAQKWHAPPVCAEVFAPPTPEWRSGCSRYRAPAPRRGGDVSARARVCWVGLITCSISSQELPLDCAHTPRSYQACLLISGLVVHISRPVLQLSNSDRPEACVTPLCQNGCNSDSTSVSR